MNNNLGAPPDCMSAIMILTVCSGVFLTIVEIASPLATLIVSLSIKTAYEECSLFKLAPKSLYEYIIFVILTSAAMLVAFVLQYKYTFKKKVQLFRFIMNFAYSASIILLLSATFTSQEKAFKQKLAASWNTAQEIKEFEKLYNCNSLKFTNHTESQFCDDFVLKKLDTVFSSSQSLGAYFSLFIVSISIYAVVGIMFTMGGIMGDRMPN